MPTISPTPLRSSKLLLAEGQTPTHFVRAALRHKNIEDQFDIMDYKGITELAVFLRTISSTTEFRKNVKSVGILRDAETDANGARQSILSAISAAKLPQPVKTNFHIFPDNNAPGCIETICLRSVEQSPRYPCVSGFIECAAKAGIDWNDGYHLDKVKAQIFITTFKPLKAFVGPVSYNGAWPWDSEVFSLFFKFLESI